MLAQYKCPGCGQMHALRELKTKDLDRFLFMLLTSGIHVEPFDNRTWLLVVNAELTLRNRSSS